MSLAKESDVEGALGIRLREAREARGLSLKSVETASEGSIRASMLGAYERREHSITAQRLTYSPVSVESHSKSFWVRSMTDEQPLNWPSGQMKQFALR